MDPLSSFEVIPSNLEQVSIHIIHRINTNGIKVSIRIIGINVAKVHEKVEPVQLFGLHDRIGIIHIVGQKEFVTANGAISCIPWILLPSLIGRGAI